jgi:acyl carrier protein
MTDHLPRTEMEKYVAGVWAKILKVDEVEIYDTFVDLGGDSMDALQVITVIERELGVKLGHERHFISTLEQVASELEGFVKK